jgi:hypothetical protein
MKKKRILGMSISLFSLICIVYIGYIIVEYYSLVEKNITPTTTKIHKGDSLIVIFVGDSWASYHSQYDQHLKTCIETRINKPTKVISRGTVGAKTKTIYMDMHTDFPSGTKELIELQPDYAIVSAGINDAVAKMGTNNYCHHYNLIINDLLSAGIKPIIIDMPQVDYKAIYQRESMIAKIRHHISSWITGAPLWTFENYRAALQSLLRQNKIKKHLIYIPASEWNPEGYADPRMLYKEDHVHLNEKGYFHLDSCITSNIYQDMMTTHDSQ